MSEEWPCPAPDCEYIGQSKAAVKGHWGGKQDENHEGAWHEAQAAFAEAREQAGEGDNGDDDGSGEKLDLPEADDGAGDGPCPECGGEKYDLVENNRKQIRAAGFDPSEAPDDARICYHCWSEEDQVTVYTV